MVSLKKRAKKGFTLVELIVVIAIIAILAAVSAVSYIAFINNANKSADEQTVTQINLALQASEVNGKCATPTDAIKVAEDNGFLVEKLTPTSSGYSYAWNSETNRFNIIDGESVVYPADHGNAKNYNLYKFVSTVEEIGSTFSTYLKADFQGTLPELTKGIDTGVIEGLENVSYVNNSGSEQKVILRLNCSKLTIDAELDTVSRYGECDILNIIKIANSSYHEFGTVKQKAIISQGHLEIEKGGSVQQVFVENVSSGKSVVVTANEPTVINVDNTSAASTSVVANTEDVFVSSDSDVTIEGTNKEEVVVAEKITTWAQIKAFEEKTNGFIKLDADILDAEQLSVNVGSIIKLDLNGHTLSTIYEGAESNGRHYYAISNKGSCEIFDSSTNGTGTIKARGVLNSGGKLTVQSGTIYNVDKNGGAAIFSETENLSNDNNRYILKSDVEYAKTADKNYYDTDLGVSISDGYYVVVDSFDNDFVCVSSDTNNKGIIIPVYNKFKVGSVGEVVINGGTFKVEYEGSSSDDAGPSTFISDLKTKVTINSGKFESKSNRTYAVILKGSSTINSATVSGNHGALAVSAGNAVVNNGTYTAKNYYGIYVAGEAGAVSCLINGGEFKSLSANAAYIGNKNTNGDGGIGAKASVEIKNGTFLGAADKASISVSYSESGFGSGKAFISGGTFSTEINSDYLTPGHTCSSDGAGKFIVK